MYCYSVIIVGTGCISFFKWEEMEVEADKKAKSIIRDDTRGAKSLPGA